MIEVKLRLQTYVKISRWSGSAQVCLDGWEPVRAGDQRRVSPQVLGRHRTGNQRFGGWSC